MRPSAAEYPLLGCSARQVVWDDETPPWGKGYPPPPSVPIVDLNDPNVILECDLIDEVAARSARSARSAGASARAMLAQDDARGSSAVPSATGGRAGRGAGRQAVGRVEGQRRALVGDRHGADAEEEEDAEGAGAQDGASVGSQRG